MISFVATSNPCVLTDHIKWHLEHGEVRDAVTPDGRKIGVVYYSILPGTGVVAHFDVPVDATISYSELKAGFTRQIQLLADCPLVLTTIDAEQRSLVRLLRKFGFVILAKYPDPDGDYLLLQLLNRQKTYIKTVTHQKERI